jgi:hypothetical protein
MRLAEKPMLRSYHALDYDWTPLSRNPCWLSNAVYRLRYYVRRNRLCLISSVGYHSTNDYYQLLLMLNSDGDKSFVDDLVASRYCKCESSLCCYEALRFILCFYDLFFSVFLSFSKLFKFKASTIDIKYRFCVVIVDIWCFWDRKKWCGYSRQKKNRHENSNYFFSLFRKLTGRFVI